MNKPVRKVTLQARADGFCATFEAMASPCEVLVDSNDAQLALQLGQIAANEAWRLEDKFSRYNPDSVCSLLNANAGKPCAIDQESYQLLCFAGQCFELSDGRFDISSGVLRKAWLFDQSDNVPHDSDIAPLLSLIGWQKTRLSEHSFTMQPGMEVDFGGLGKEYAVDRSLLLIGARTTVPVLINFGGDLAVNGPRANNQPWQIGIDHPSFSSAHRVIVTMRSGAVATSGDAQRFLLKAGKRYSHILNLATGWPVENPPHSITVAAPQCIQAGFLATLALLHGENAEHFLTDQDILHWAIR